jgi:hypothetical protein
MPTIASLTSFTANTKAKAAEVNANFSSIRTTVNTYAAFVDATATITGAWTFSTAPVFTNAQTFAAAVTITTGGLTVTAGGATITAGGLTVTAGTSSFGAGVTITGTCAATTFSGSGASLTSIPASAVSSGTFDSARLPTTFSSATTFSAGGAAIVVSNDGRISFTSAAAAASKDMLALTTAYVQDSGTTLPAFSAGPVGGASGNFRWIRVLFAGSPAWIPILVA